MPDRLPSVVPTRKVLDQLRIQEAAFFSEFCKDPRKIIIVAGTNGKGSVSATLEALFRAAGENVGLYTSPHLETINERIRFNGVNISDSAFVQAYQDVSRRADVAQLTHFELLTVMAVDYFLFSDECAKLDRIILEVGLGGASDATNAVPHGMCIFTTIGLDHTQILGDTREQIATQKLGVLDGVPGDVVPVIIHGPLDAEIAPAFQRRRTQHAIGTWTQTPAYSSMTQADPPFTTQIQSAWGTAELKLVGDRAAWNTNTALTAFEASGYDPGLYLEALKDVSWFGRFEAMRAVGFRHAVWLSGDHNPEGIASLIEIVGRSSKPIAFVVGIGHEKDLTGILDPLLQLPAAKVFLTETPFRGRTISDYGSYLDRCEKYSANWKQLLEELDSSWPQEGTIVVTGSLYLVGAVRSWLKAKA